MRSVPASIPATSLLLALAACGTNYTIKSGDPADTADVPVDTADDPVDTAETGDPTDTAETGETGLPDDGTWDEATLRILSPGSGDFLPLGEPADFEAHVYDADGEEKDFDDVVWTSSSDAAWILTGTDFEDASLDAGEHDLTATARLPNGDRLAYTVGGILVQSVYSGTYTGTITVSATMEYEGTPITLAGAGGTTLFVDPQGIYVTGTAECVVSLAGYYDLDLQFAIDAVNDGGAITGTAEADLSLISYDFDVTGEITEDGELTLAFGDDVYGYLDIVGDVDATRISRETEASE